MRLVGRWGAPGTGPGFRAYDAVFFFECVRDFGRPVEALAAARTAVADGGAVIVMDEGAGDRPRVGDRLETFLASASTTGCLPKSRVVSDCEPRGTVMRPATFEDFARRTRWAGAHVLLIRASGVPVLPARRLKRAANTRRKP